MGVCYCSTMLKLQTTLVAMLHIQILKLFDILATITATRGSKRNLPIGMQFPTWLHPCNPSVVAIGFSFCEMK